MRAKFARTLRLHMRDATLYTHPGTHVWTAADSDLVDLLLRAIHQNPTLLQDDDHPTESQDDKLRAAATVLAPDLDLSQLSRVWARMQTFPYIFEIAAARGTVDTLTLQGTPLAEASTTHAPSLVSRIHYQGRHVAL